MKTVTNDYSLPFGTVTAENMTMDDVRAMLFRRDKCALCCCRVHAVDQRLIEITTVILGKTLKGEVALCPHCWETHPVARRIQTGIDHTSTITFRGIENETRDTGHLREAYPDRTA